MTADLVGLADCPGCGGSDTRVIGGPGTRGGPKYWAGCDHCRWRTWGDTEADAVTAWNTRAELRALAGAEVGSRQYTLSYRGATGYWHIACGSRDVMATEDKDKASYYLELLNYPPPGSGRGGVEYTREQRLQDEAELAPGVAPSVSGFKAAS